MIFKAYILVVFGLLLVSGCASKNPETHRTIVLQNKSSKEMRETTMNIGSYQMALGFMGREYAKVVGNYPKPFPDIVHVLWSSRGVEHDEAVSIAAAVAGANRGVLLLTVYDDRIDAKFEVEKKPAK